MKKKKTFDMLVILVLWYFFMLIAYLHLSFLLLCENIKDNTDKQTALTLHKLKTQNNKIKQAAGLN